MQAWYGAPPYGDYQHTLLCVEDRRQPWLWHCSKHASVKEADDELLKMASPHPRSTLLFPPWIVWQIPSLLRTYAQWRLQPHVMLTEEKES